MVTTRESHLLHIVHVNGFLFEAMVFDLKKILQIANFLYPVLRTVSEKSL